MKALSRIPRTGLWLVACAAAAGLIAAHQGLANSSSAQTTVVVTEATNSAATVSPDHRTIVMDVQGVLCLFVAADRDGLGHTRSVRRYVLRRKRGLDARRTSHAAARRRTTRTAVATRRVPPATSSQVDQDPAGVGRVGLHADVELLDVLLRQHGQHPLLQLARALARDDLDDVDPGGGGLEEGLAQREVDVAVVAEDRVQIQREQDNPLRCARSPAAAGDPRAARTVAAYVCLRVTPEVLVSPGAHIIHACDVGVHEVRPGVEGTHYFAERLTVRWRLEIRRRSARGAAGRDAGAGRPGRGRARRRPR